MRWIAPLILVILLSLCLSGCGTAIAPEVGSMAPDFTLPTLDGASVRLSELKGKPVLVNFWATWCKPCVKEIPYFQAAFEERGKAMEFIAANLGEDVEKVKEFAQDKGMTFTVALDKDGAVAEAYNIRYIPTTFLIDKQGVIRHIKVGAFASEEELLSLLDSL